MKHNVFLSNFLKSSQFRGSLRLRINRDGRRHAHKDAIQRQSNFWIPQLTLGKEHGPPSDTTQLLTRAGYVRQAYSGIFHMLPLGLRVQEKIERLIDKHMSSIGASKVSLSSISSQELWHRSGRLSTGSEIFKFADRKDAQWILAPTHEEEITSLVGSLVQSYKDLPIRLYQISRKYRDERRPRGGLLRGREFIMKDLYTFDQDEYEARATYDAVRSAYTNFFDELKVEYLQARADSGNMGGSLSHEYHLPNSNGEDNIIRCSNCGFARNEELVDEVLYEQQKIALPHIQKSRTVNARKPDLEEFIAITKDDGILVKAYAPKLNQESSENSDDEMNTFAIKAAFPKEWNLDTGVEDPTRRFASSLNTKRSVDQKKDHTIYYLFDDRIEGAQISAQIELDFPFLIANKIRAFRVTSQANSLHKIDLLKRRKGDPCPSCDEKTLEIQRAIEVGHTFHLGTRYSSKLGAKILQPGASEATAIEMGCHGIGVSRLVAAVAACLADEKGLNWPRVIAPFQVVIIVPREQTPELDEAVVTLSENLASIPSDPDSEIDVLIDDRKAENLGWKMNDADMVGYPVLVVFGKAWKERKVEVQCRQLKIKTNVAYDDAPSFVQSLLQQL